MIAYRGPSALTGAPIIAVVTGLRRLSTNRKCGDMCQLWILVAEHEPHVAARAAIDDSVCGECPLRPTRDGGCYVVPHQGPLSVYRAHHDSAVDLDGACAALSRYALPIRLGAYGDIAAIPESVVARLAAAASGHTAYSHSWRAHSWVLRYAQASVESSADAYAAWKLGGKTFRIGTRPVWGEKPCASDRTTCSKCLACDGRTSNRVIAPHGSQRRRLQVVA